MTDDFVSKQEGNNQQISLLTWNGLLLLLYGMYVYCLNLKNQDILYVLIHTAQPQSVSKLITPWQKVVK